MPKIPLIEVGVSDLKNLRASGLKDSTIESNKLRTKNDALEFPYRDLNGVLNGFIRSRPHKPRITDGKSAKYVQPKGSPLHAYFPVASLVALREGKQAVFITEGEKKALALSQLGYAAVGIGGIWCGCKANSEALIDDLVEIDWSDRDVYIVFDHDPKYQTRQKAENARSRLAKALSAAGARKVYNVQLPPGPTGSKQGVDDFLLSQGGKAFSELVRKAIRVIKIIPSVAGASGANPVIKIIPPVLGEEAYHGPIGEFLRVLAPLTEATDAGILAHLLPAIGTIIGPGTYAYAGTNQPPRINTVLVGPTSTGRKGTSLAPVDQLMSLVDPAFSKKQRVGGLSTGEGLIAKVADKRTKDEDGNEETESVEKRLYVVEEEFSKVLAQIRRDGNILSQILRESYDSGNLSVLTRADPLQADGAHISITGHITQEELLDRFNHIEMANGFGNRFLWFVVKSDKILPLCGPIPSKLFQRLVQIVRRVSDYRVGHVPLADASMGMWEKEIYPTLREDKPGFAGALVARGSAMVLRIALIYFLLDLPSKGESQGIAPVHLEAALAVWKYCEESVRLLFGCRAGSFLGDKLLELLAGAPMSKDEINNHLSPKQKAEASSVLASLEEQGLIRKTTRKAEGAGRPATVWERAE